ncbi:RNA recognition motif domain-containing protein [Leptospira sp. GIMC2001]|uniref:RNA recognition motif domain-containing protein n=1 Tax=Leptospira sp. GIMC2001 TaxID=1513297 RepID=UPI00234AA4F3|nr:RNA-binding protein [Leptospira sp. GIMC2001]WCL48374.1 RNA-binding protein [Leptospira sp. GIMC2001]
MNIYVGNLSYGMTDSALEALFTQFGSVSDSKIIIDRETGRSKGFGFVEMSNNQEGEEAIRQLNGKEIEGRSLRVNEAKPNTDKPRRGPRH